MTTSTFQTSNSTGSFHSLDMEATEMAPMTLSSDDRVDVDHDSSSSNRESIISEKLSNASYAKTQGAIEMGKETTENEKANDNIASLLTQNDETISISNAVIYMTKWQSLKNLGILCTAFFLLFSSFRSMSYLQSSINKAGGIGTFSLAAVYVGMTVSSMFLSPIFIVWFGLKLCIGLGMIMYVIYMAANLYPVWGIMVPAAVLCGIGAGTLWASQSSYVSQLSRSYAKATNMKPKDSISFLFGIFYMCVNAGKASGNLLASVLLKQGKSSNISMTSEEIEDCMANKQEAVDNATTLERPDDTTMYLICGTWIGVAVVGIIVLAFLTSVPLDGDLASTDRKRKHICNKFLSTATHLRNSRLQRLLVPITLYQGLSSGFLIADFTKSIVGCTFGIDTVGDVMLCNEICNAVFSGLIGRLVKNFGHLPFFTLAFLCQGSVQVILVFWKPGQEHFYVIFFFAGMWGVTEAIIKTQNAAIHGHLFADNTEAAFGNYFVFEAIGLIISFSYSTFVSTDIKLYILLGLLACSAISYYIVEYINRKHKRRQDRDSPTNC